MAFGGDGTSGTEYGGERIPSRRKVSHYHGDEVRVLFFVSALIVVIAQSTGAALPFSTFGAVLVAVLLVVAAGITNPNQSGIHWINGLIALLGTVVFATTAVAHYQSGMSLSDMSFVYVESLALLSLFALYFSTRTLRGVLLKRKDT